MLPLALIFFSRDHSPHGEWLLRTWSAVIKQHACASLWQTKERPRKLLKLLSIAMHVQIIRDLV